MSARLWPCTTIQVEYHVSLAVTTHNYKRWISCQLGCDHTQLYKLNIMSCWLWPRTTVQVEYHVSSVVTICLIPAECQINLFVTTHLIPAEYHHVSLFVTTHLIPAEYHVSSVVTTHLISAIISCGITSSGAIVTM